MENKKIYDFRGKQTNLERQLAFNKEGFIHMIFYRVLIIISIITFFVFLLSFWLVELFTVVVYLIIIIWVLFIPQLFALLKGLAMIGSKGIEFGRLNDSYISALKTNKKMVFGYALFPYLMIGVWIFGLGLFIFGVVI